MNSYFYWFASFLDISEVSPWAFWMCRSPTHPLLLYVLRVEDQVSQLTKKVRKRISKEPFLKKSWSLYSIFSDNLWVPISRSHVSMCLYSKRPFPWLGIVENYSPYKFPKNWEKNSGQNKRSSKWYRDNFQALHVAKQLVILSFSTSQSLAMVLLLGSLEVGILKILVSKDQYYLSLPWLRPFFQDSHWSTAQKKEKEKEETMENGSGLYSVIVKLGE